MAGETRSRNHIMQLLILARIQLLLLAASGLALTWFPYSREQAAQRLLRRNRILFLAISEAENGRGPSWDIWMMNLDGSGRTALTRDKALEIDPIWSPDGKQIAFAAATDPKERKTDIHVMNADGTRRHRPTDMPIGTVAACPTWSPNGRRIAYYTQPWDGGERDRRCVHLYVIDANGKNLQWLATGSAPSWSPDGKSLLYTDFDSEEQSAPLALWVMDVNSGRTKRLARKAGFGAWSPNGRWIACLSDEDEKSRILMMNADGSEPTPLTKPEGSEQQIGFQWMPDGRSIAFTRWDLSPFCTPELTRACVLDIHTRRETELTKLKRSIWEATSGSYFGAFTFRMLGSSSVQHAPLDQALLDAIWPETKDVDTVKALLQKGADPNVRHQFLGYPALHLALHERSAPITRALIEHGADVNASSDRGLTALMRAAWFGNTPVVMLLLRHGADPTMKDRKGRTAMSLATQEKHSTIVRLLKRAGESS